MAIVATLSKDVAAKLKADAIAEGRSTDEIADEAIMLRRQVRDDPSAVSHLHVANSVQKTIHHAPFISGSFNGWFARWFEKAKIWIRVNFPGGFIGGYFLGIFMTTYIFKMGGL